MAMVIGVISRIQSNPYILSQFKAEIEKPLWLNAPVGTGPFTAPNFSKTSTVVGRLEAEYASAPAMWEAGDAVSGYGVPLALLGSSNDGQFLIFANGGSIVFDEGLIAASSMKVAYTSNNAGSFNVFVDGNLVQEVSFPDNGGNIVEAEIATEIQTTTSSITIQVASGNVVFFDYVQLQANTVDTSTDTPDSGGGDTPSTPPPGSGGDSGDTPSGGSNFTDDDSGCNTTTGNTSNFGLFVFLLVFGLAFRRKSKSL